MAGGGGGYGGGGGLAADDLLGQLSVQAMQDLEQVKAVAGAASRKLASAARAFLSDLQGGY